MWKTVLVDSAAVANVANAGGAPHHLSLPALSLAMPANQPHRHRIAALAHKPSLAPCSSLQIGSFRSQMASDLTSTNGHALASSARSSIARSASLELLDLPVDVLSQIAQCVTCCHGSRGIRADYQVFDSRGADPLLVSSPYSACPVPHISVADTALRTRGPEIIGSVSAAPLSAANAIFVSPQ